MDFWKNIKIFARGLIAVAIVLILAGVGQALLGTAGLVIGLGLGAAVCGYAIEKYGTKIVPEG